MDLEELKRQAESLDPKTHKALRDALIARFGLARMEWEQSKQSTAHIDTTGTLVIPFSGPRRFHWWNRGQGILETLLGLGADDETIKQYIGDRRNGNGRPH